MTALEACHKFDNQFKCCVAIDPVFTSRWEQVEKDNKFIVKTPFLIVSNEWFQSPKRPIRDYFQDWKVICKFYKDSLKVQNDPEGKISQNVVLEGSYHLVQFDWALRDTIFLKLVREIGIFVDVEAKQRETIALMIGFIQKTLDQ